MKIMKIVLLTSHAAIGLTEHQSKKAMGKKRECGMRE